MTNAEKVVALLKEQKKRIAFAESCTAGLVAATLVDVPDASSVLDMSCDTSVTVSQAALQKSIAASSNNAIVFFITVLSLIVVFITLPLYIILKEKSSDI